MLAVDHLGSDSESGPQLVVVHGFTQNARCWGRFGAELARHWRVLAVDAPGHGRSRDDDADLNRAGQLIVEAGGDAHYLGYSMGGRMLLHAALEVGKPVVESLVLVGATAGIDSEPDRSERRTLDAERATEATDLGTEEFVNRWLSGPLFGDLTEEQACRRERFTNRAEGLAASLLHCGTGSQEPLWDRLPTLEMPVLVLAGTRDTKFTALGRRLVDAIGSNASFRAVEGGHAAHLQNPQAAADTIREWRSQIT